MTQHTALHINLKFKPSQPPEINEFLYNLALNEIDSESQVVKEIFHWYKAVATESGPNIGELEKEKDPTIEGMVKQLQAAISGTSNEYPEWDKRQIMILDNGGLHFSSWSSVCRPNDCALGALLIYFLPCLDLEDGDIVIRGIFNNEYQERTVYFDLRNETFLKGLGYHYVNHDGQRLKLHPKFSLGKMSWTFQLPVSIYKTLELCGFLPAEVLKDAKEYAIFKPYPG